jgi:addiction module HigA family antidote
VLKVPPNPSLKPSPNGGPSGPQAGVVHLEEDDLVSTASASTINGVFAVAGRMLVPTTLRLSTITQYRLAKEIDMPAQRISEIVVGRRAIDADTDLRLCRFSGLSSGYWLRAQEARDTEVAER